MKSLAKSLKLLRKDKSADEESGGFGFITNILITIAIGGLIIFIVWMTIRKFV